MRKHEKVIVDWVVRFDNRATHHCKSYDEAMQFAREMRDTATYGNPVAITKHTRYVTSVYDDVFVFDEQ